MISADDRELGAPLDAHRIDENALAAYLRHHIADFGDGCSIRQFRGGQSNPTYLLQTANKQYVLRKKPPGKLLPSAHAVDREFRVIAALAGSAVPVPKALHLCEDETVIGQVFYVMNYVAGRVYTDPALPGCLPAERSTAYHAAVSVLASLHRVDYLQAGLETFGKADDYVARQVARWSQQYAASAVEDCAAMDQLMHWLPANNPGEHAAAIVHGDFRPGNLIFARDDMTVAAVLDWELATIGHPMADLGYFLVPYRMAFGALGMGLGGDEAGKLGLPGESALIETYVASTGCAQTPNIDYYIVFSMFRLAAILAGVLRRGLDGNASDPAAIARGRAYRQFADTAWTIARQL